MASRHQKLARVLNAIYLQMRIADDKIDELDLIAGLWDVDRVVIEQFFSVELNALGGSLYSFEQIVDGLPNDMEEIVDVEEITKKMDYVKKITPEEREAMRNATEKDAIPGFLTDGSFSDYNFKDNPATVALQQLETVKKISKDDFKVSKLADMIFSLDEIFKHLSIVPEWLKEVQADLQKNLNSLVMGFEASSEFDSRWRNFQDLPKLFDNMEKSLSRLITLNDVYDVSNMQRQSSDLEISMSLHQLSSDPSIASAFLSLHNIPDFLNDWQDEWILSVLNGGDNLRNLVSNFEQSGKLLDMFMPIKQFQAHLMRLEYIDSMKIISNFIYEAYTFQRSFNGFMSAPLSSCFKCPNMMNKMRLTELKKLSSDLDALIKIVPSLIEKLSNAEKLYSSLVEVAQSFRVILNSDNFEAWKSGTDIVHLKTKIEEAQKVFDSIIQDDEMVKSIKRLSESKDKLVAAQKWIEEFTISKKECDFLFTFDTSDLITINKLPKTIKLIHSKNTMEKFKNFLYSFADLREELRKFKISRFSDIRKKGVFRVQNPEDLLDVAIAVRGFEMLVYIYENQDFLNVLIDEGEEVMKSIEEVKDPDNKESLREIWSSYPELRDQLLALKANNEKMMATVIPLEPEEHLADIGSVYSKLGTMDPLETIKLHKLRLSMSLFEEPNQKVKEALEKLETPLSMDWSLIHEKFKKVPGAMDRLTKDFDEYFQRQVKVRGVWDWMAANLLYIYVSTVFTSAAIGLTTFAIYHHCNFKPEEHHIIIVKKYR